MKKGFMHIIEIIIVVLLVFITMFQFTYIPGVKSDWANTKLYLLGGDILYTLDREGVNWFDPEAVDAGISPYLGSSIEYDLRIGNAIKPEILVGCLCSLEEYVDLTQSLNIPSVMNINGQEIRFTIELLDSVSPEFSVKYDVIVIGQDAFDMGLAGHSNQIDTFLSYDRGIIELVDLDAQEDLDDIQEMVFGIMYQSSIAPDSGSLDFTVRDVTYNIAPPIKKYFHHFPNATGEFYGEPHSFGNVLLPEERINVSDGATERIILEQSSSGAAACIINYNMVDNAGRTAWISAPEGSPEDDMSVFLRAIVAWAAGDTYELRSNSLLKGDSVSFSFFKVLNEDMYQPIEIMFSMGKVYAY